VQPGLQWRLRGRGRPTAAPAAREDPRWPHGRDVHHISAGHCLLDEQGVRGSRRRLRYAPITRALPSATLCMNLIRALLTSSHCRWQPGVRARVPQAAGGAVGCGGRGRLLQRRAVRRGAGGDRRSAFGVRPPACAYTSRARCCRTPLPLVTPHCLAMPTTQPQHMTCVL
jgi:hypothetical protein